jgi:hypothetical protein
MRPGLLRQLAEMSHHAVKLEFSFQGKGAMDYFPRPTHP